jgi:hypothetical protein
MCQIGFFFLLTALAGCQSAGLPHDPLFANRKPVESKTQSGPPLDLPGTEPAPPPQLFYVPR